MKSAMIFWTLIAKINTIAKSNPNDDLVITAVTKLVNGGTNGLDERKKYTKKAFEILKNKKELKK